MAMLRISICVAMVSGVALMAAPQSATAQPPAPTEAPDVLRPTPHAVPAGMAPCATGCCDACDRGHCGGLRHRLFGESDRNCRDRLRRWADHHLCDTCYCPMPLGACLNGTLDAQIAKGDAAQMVLYDYDFENGGDQLTCRGKMQVRKLAKMLMETPYPVIIEAARCNENLDEARRLAVLAYLEQTTMPVPAERIVVAAPPAHGLDGLDAEGVNVQIQNLWIQGGYRPTGGSEHIIGGGSGGGGGSTGNTGGAGAGTGFGAGGY